MGVEQRLIFVGENGDWTMGVRAPSGIAPEREEINPLLLRTSVTKRPIKGVDEDRLSPSPY